MIGSHTDPAHYRFPRQQSRWSGSIQKSPPVFSHMDKIKAIGVMLLAFGAVPLIEFLYWTL